MFGTHPWPSRKALSASQQRGRVGRLLELKVGHPDDLLELLALEVLKHLLGCEGVSAVDLKLRLEVRGWVQVLAVFPSAATLWQEKKRGKVR